MANVDFFSAFGYAWGENGAIDQWVDTQYKLGWASIGSVPPSVEQFNRVQQIADQKANWLFGQLKTVADGLGIVLAAGDLEGLKKVLAAATVRAATFSEVDALTEDQGPIIVTDMAGGLYTWTNTAYFTGYRNPRSGLWYGGDSDTPEAWELLATGGVWSESNPKHARVIARYRERGRTVTSGAWLKGWNHIASLGSGDWKAPDLRDVFQRMSGTDADTANPRLVGSSQNATAISDRNEYKAAAGANYFGGTSVRNSDGSIVGQPSTQGFGVSTTVSGAYALEVSYRYVRPINAAVAPVILI
jgi:hypothetical protein